MPMDASRASGYPLNDTGLWQTRSRRQTLADRQHCRHLQQRPAACPCHRTGDARDPVHLCTITAGLREHTASAIFRAAPSRMWKPPAPGRPALGAHAIRLCPARGGGLAAGPLRERIFATGTGLHASMRASRSCWSPHGGVMDVLPPGHAPGFPDATHLGAEQLRHQSRLLLDARQPVFAGWADTAHLQQGSRDEAHSEHLQTLVSQSVKRMTRPRWSPDLDAMDRKLSARMARFCPAAWRALAPACQTAQSAHIAPSARACHACGHCVQKVSEAGHWPRAASPISSSATKSSPKLLVRVAALAKRTGMPRADDWPRSSIARRASRWLARALQDAQAGDASHGCAGGINVGQNRRAARVRRSRPGSWRTAIAAQPVLRFAGLQAYHAACPASARSRGAQDRHRARCSLGQPHAP